MEREKEFRKWLEGVFQEYKDMYREALDDDADDRGRIYLSKANLVSRVIEKFEEVFGSEED